MGLTLLFLTLSLWLAEVPAFVTVESSCRRCGLPFASFATKSAAPLQENALETDFLLHKGVTAKFMPKWPAIVTYTAVSGWTDETSRWFQKSVENVLKLNPILTGRVYRHYSGARLFKRGQLQLRVDPHFFGQGDDFVEIVNAPPDMTPLGAPDMKNCAASLQHVQETIIPFMGIRCESTGEDIRRKLPLFHVKVLRFPDGTACYGMKMAHCLGDGVTYFRILEQIKYFLNQEALRAGKKPVNNILDGTATIFSMIDENPLPSRMRIDWNHPLKASFECFPDTFSQKDRRNAYGWPFYLGILFNIHRLVTKKKNKPTYKRLMVLDREKIEQVKQEYLRRYPEGTRLSTNDLITAGICQSCQSTDIFSVPFNQRGRGRDNKNQFFLDHNTAGYLCKEVPFARQSVLEPMDMRKIVSKGGYYKSDELPMGPYVKGRNGRISNFASVQSKSMFDSGPCGLETICHCMPVNFFDIFPIDVCMIFPVDKNHIGVMHNFAKFVESDALDKMTVFTMEPTSNGEED